MGTSLESTQNFGVHHDGHVTLGHELLITCLHTFLHPVGKGPSHQSVGTIDDPLSRQTTEVISVREVVGRHRVLGRLGEELLDAETFVLRHGQVLNTVSMKEFLRAHDELLQEVDGDVLVSWQVRMALDGSKVVPEHTVSRRRVTYTSRLDLYLAANDAAVTD